jgi:23S rRNA (pseudouridine1915-N3)-methyltransferase
MRILVAAVGRARPGPARELFESYRARLRWPLALKEVEARGKLPPAQLKAREATLLLAAVSPQAIVVTLDENGAQLSSREFADRLGAWQDQGIADLAFLIGGAEGHGDAVRQRADFALALGRLTWPHLLVRGLLAEQLYRAQQILSGHPYHRD